MNTATKLQPVIIITTAILGLLLGYFTSLGNYSANFIEIFLMALLYFIFLSIDLKGFKDSFLNIKFAFTELLINFIWTPIFALLLGIIFLNTSIDLRLGLLMLLVTPCTDWYLVFTGLAKGNVTLGAALLPLNFLLQIILLPVYLLLFMGGQVQFNGSDIILSIITVLIIPFAIAQLTKLIVNKSICQEKFYSSVLKHSDNLQLFFLCLAIISMFSSESKTLINNPILLIKMILPLGVFFAINFILVQFIGKKLKFDYDDIISLNLITLARNSPLSLSIAVAAFPDRPIISLVLVIGPLIELPVLALTSNILLRLKKTY